jgi:2-polyprenyl-6-methoxyphenol hydroxylase-like FAD-dependent oxidoreductase
MKTRSFSPSGELINSSDDGGIIAKLQAQDGGERIFIPWHTLQSELADALPAGIVRTRHRFLGYTETADGVVAEFDTPDGVQRVAASLLVGCDGGQSMVREQLLGDGPPKYMGALGVTCLQHSANICHVLFAAEVCSSLAEILFLLQGWRCGVPSAHGQLTGQLTRDMLVLEAWRRPAR